jgi:hypothetical protein
VAMTLQEAIDFAANPPLLAQFGIEVIITISMHDEAHNVLVGAAFGDSTMFRPDLPLLHPGVATIAGGAATLTVGGSQSVPGFSTRGTGTNAMLGTIPIDFSVRRDPGNPRLIAVGRGGPSVQIEIETLSPVPAGTVTGGFELEVAEDGALLRAVGPSLKAPATKASYTATIAAVGRPG